MRCESLLGWTGRVNGQAHLVVWVSNVPISIESCVLMGLVFYRSYKNKIKLSFTKSGTPSITQITKPHKHTQQSITDAYRKDKIRRFKLFGNGENEGKQKNTFE